MADMVGISRATYIDFETGAIEYYEREVVDKLAVLFQIHPLDLLDDYNRFIYQGQGKQIREYRQLLGIGKKPLARLIGATPNCIRAWESEEKRISRKSWEKYFKGRI